MRGATSDAEQPVSTSEATTKHAIRDKSAGEAYPPAGRMVVREDHRRCIVRERRLDDLARIDARLRQRASEELDVLDEVVLRIHQQRDEDLVGQLASFVRKKSRTSSVPTVCTFVEKPIDHALRRAKWCAGKYAAAA